MTCVNNKVIEMKSSLCEFICYLDAQFDSPLFHDELCVELETIFHF